MHVINFDVWGCRQRRKHRPVFLRIAVLIPADSPVTGKIKLVNSQISLFKRVRPNNKQVKILNYGPVSLP